MSTVELWQSPWKAFRVAGPDAASWINGMVTCDAERVTEKTTTWGSLLTKQGKIQADLHLFGRPDELCVVVAGAERDEVSTLLDGYLVMEDAEILPSDLIWLVLLSEAIPPDVFPARAPVVGFQPFAGSAYLIGLEPEELERLKGSGLVRLVDEEAWTEARLAANFPEWSREYSASDNLHGAALERRTVDWDKGCYLGQEVVCMQEMRGKVRRRLVRLALVESPAQNDAPRPGLDGSSLLVHRGDAPVGEVVTLGQSAAFARVETPHDVPGTALLLQTQDGGWSCEALVSPA